MTAISTVSVRDKLKPQHEPYWMKLSTGCYLGFRKMTATSVGTWIVRFWDVGAGIRAKKSLGEFGDLPPSERFNAAKKAADAWFAHLDRGGSVEVVTVKRACELYVAHLRATRGDKPANDAEARFGRWIYNEKALPEIELQKLTRARLDKWRKAIAATPAKINRDDREEPVTRPRSPSTVNRDVTTFRAALNYAHDLGHVTSDTAWRVVLRPEKNADRRREAYIDINQRRSLIEKADPAIAPFLKGLSLLPLRPGALAALTVAQFDKKLGVLSVGKDKAGGDRKIKLPIATSQFFAEQAKGKLPGAFLFPRPDGKQLTKDDWKGPIREAVTASGLPAGVTAYTLRHSTITDLVSHAGLDLLTVAALSGTSAVMIEKHYGHLQADRAAAALATLKL